MKSIQLAISACAVLALSAFTVIQSTSWKVNEDTYSVTFKGGKEEGSFRGLRATIQFDEMAPGKARIYASIDANSINTGNGMKNKHAKGDDALNVKQFPENTFASESVTGKPGSYIAKGKLTLRGVTRDVNLPFTFTNKGTESVFNGKLTVNTKDYGITKSHAPEVVDITIAVPVTRQ